MIRHQLGRTAHADNVHVLEAEAGGQQVQSQTVLYSETVSKKAKEDLGLSPHLEAEYG